MLDCDGGVCEIGRNAFSGIIRVGLECVVNIGVGVTFTAPAYIFTAEKAVVYIGVM